jgi:hypothetical protein
VNVFRERQLNQHPWIAGSALSRSMVASNSACEVSGDIVMVTECMPPLHARPLFRTYTWLAGSAPTRTTASPGVTPPVLSRATSAATS